MIQIDHDKSPALTMEVLFMHKIHTEKVIETNLLAMIHLSTLTGAVLPTVYHFVIIDQCDHLVAFPARTMLKYH